MAHSHRSGGAGSPLRHANSLGRRSAFGFGGASSLLSAGSTVGGGGSSSVNSSGLSPRPQSTATTAAFVQAQHPIGPATISSSSWAAQKDGGSPRLVEPVAPGGTGRSDRPPLSQSGNPRVRFLQQPAAGGVGAVGGSSLLSRSGIIGGGDSTELGNLEVWPAKKISKPAAVVLDGVVSRDIRETAEEVDLAIGLGLPRGSVEDGPSFVTAGGSTLASTAAADSLTPKPRLLKQLEEFLEEELKRVGASSEDSSPGTGHEASPLRLQVYREAFQFFIEEFRTYRPFLSSVKREYELLLDSYSSKLNSVQPLKARLSTIKQEAAHLMHETSKEHAAALASLQAQLSAAQASAKESVDLASQRAKQVASLEQELAEVAENYKHARGSNKTLVLALRRVEDELKATKNTLVRLEQQVFDLSNKLHAASETKRRAEQELEELQEATRYMISVRDARAKDTQIAALTSSVAELTNKLESLNEEHQAMLGTMRQLSSRREAVEQERDRVNRMRAAVLNKPPPKWMRQLAEALEVEAMWKENKNTEAKAGDDRIVFDEFFDPDEMLTKLLDAAAHFKARIKELEEAPRTIASSSSFRRPQPVTAGAVGTGQRMRTPSFRGRTSTTPNSRSMSIRFPGSRPGTQEGGLLALSTDIHGLDVSEFEPVPSPRHGDSTPNTPGDQLGKVVAQPIVAADDMLGASPDDPEFVAVRPLLAKAQTRMQFFTGLGADVTVPRYLRANGKVRNVGMSKADVERLIKECWIAKTQLGQSASTTTMADFFHTFLKRQYPAPGQAVEVAYTAVDAMRKYSYDSDLSVFLQVLEGHLPEAVHHEALSMLQRYTATLTLLDRRLHNGMVTSTVPRKEFLEMLHTEFRTKPDDSFTALERALVADIGDAETIKYVELFAETADGDQGKFCEELREQHLQEFKDYCALLRKQITAASMPGKVPDVVVGFAAAAIQEVDPLKPEGDISQMLARGCGCPVEALNMEAKVPVAQFLHRLCSHWMERSTPFAYVHSSKNSVQGSTRPSTGVVSTN